MDCEGSKLVAGSSVADQWTAWLATRRHGGDREQLRRVLKVLGPIRDDVIAHAAVASGDTVLDVGCGDGLIAFAAAEAVGPSGSVTFSDISRELLEHCRQLATAAGINGRCRFVSAAASDLTPIADQSVDAVTVRSVLIYEADKAAAFAEFYRVLRPGGRLSIFEPINRFGADERHEREDRLRGYDVAGVSDLAARVKNVYEAIQPPRTDPMLDFDERDLLQLAEKAGFAEIHLQLRADIERAQPISWETARQIAGNPRIPSLAEAMAQALTPDEAERLSTHLRPQAEHGTARRRTAVTQLWATRTCPR